MEEVRNILQLPIGLTYKVDRKHEFAQILFLKSIEETIFLKIV
jgi:hypothetical protein